MRILLEDERAILFHGDSGQLDLPENSVDAAVFDPPAAISFMGQGWDDDRGGFDGWTTWLAKTLAPTYRALKPGAHGLCWALPRTSHWTARAIELAGFEIRDMHHDAIAADTGVAAFVESLDNTQRRALAWLLETQAPPIFYQVFGVGFPKSLTSKSADIPEGTGTALKPAVEHWILFRKPLNGSVADNVAEHGTGVLNIDACRIGVEVITTHSRGNNGAFPKLPARTSAVGRQQNNVDSNPHTGRWPAHLSLEHAPGCEPAGETVEKIIKYANAGDTDRDGNGTSFAMGIQRVAGEAKVTHTAYRCALGCPVRALDEQSGFSRSPGKVTRGGKRGLKFGMAEQRDVSCPSDSGGASRFFFNAPPFAYVGKAARSEKDAGLEHLTPTTGGEATGRDDNAAGVNNPRAGAGRTGGARNAHPTVKSIALMQWLLKLIAPPGGVVLDPFAGSATTGVAALELGLSFIGCEQGGPKNKYLPIYVGRIRNALGLPPDLTVVADPDDDGVEQSADVEGSDSVG